MIVYFLLQKYANILISKNIAVNLRNKKEGYQRLLCRAYFI